MRVTVGIPFFNNERTLRSAIQSVFAQRLQDWELILVDDGSTDGSLQIAHGIHDPRVRVVSDGRNLGLASRLNQISRMAAGEYIARMDADDIMHPRRLELQVEYLERHREVDLVGSACFTIDGSARLLGLGYSLPLDTRPAAVLRKCLVPHPTCTGRRAWFERNPYNESTRRAQDMELWVRTASTSVVAKLDEPLLFLRMTGDGSPWAYLRKTFRGMANHLRVVWRRGPGMIGWIRSYLMISRIVAFSVSLIPFVLLNKQAAFIHRRSRSLGSAERDAAEQILDRIHAVEVPGWRAASREAAARS